MKNGANRKRKNAKSTKRWAAVKDEDIPCENFTWDEELNTFVHTGSSNTVKH